MTKFLQKAIRDAKKWFYLYERKKDMWKSFSFVFSLFDEIYNILFKIIL